MEMQEAINKALEEYHNLVELAESTFAKVAESHADEVRCHEGCISCCHAPFDLSLIEAISLQNAFKKKIPYGGFRSAIATAATQAERTLIKEKKRFHQLTKEGYTHSAVLQEAAKLQIRCPLLGPDDACVLYDDRPITCRLYGIPLAINKEVHVCGESGFKRQYSYPTVFVSRFQDSLSEISKQLQEDLNSVYNELYKVYIPLSSAILHPIDKTWLGIKTKK